MIRIIRLIGSVLIVLVGFVLGILVNNALADMFIEIVNGLEQLPVRSDI